MDDVIVIYNLWFVHGANLVKKCQLDDHILPLIGRCFHALIRNVLVVLPEDVSSTNFSDYVSR